MTDDKPPFEVCQDCGCPILKKDDGLHSLVLLFGSAEDARGFEDAIIECLPQSFQAHHIPPKGDI